jgi:hypothetical protein
LTKQSEECFKLKHKNRGMHYSLQNRVQSEVSIIKLKTQVKTRQECMSLCIIRIVYCYFVTIITFICKIEISRIKSVQLVASHILHANFWIVFNLFNLYIFLYHQLPVFVYAFFNIRILKLQGLL